ncbi:MAG: 4Fe-4S cluster-binding domain-containing protein [Treponema sp.]|jgi:MoaA/NifB/PqqE/SkfB family radical SAM enzyme|nr:4Fe-4S cluster-binding domain-containing protein [Treponema sp.]
MKEQKKERLNVDTILRSIRNNIVKIFPESSLPFKLISLVGLRINAKKHHVPLSTMVMGVYAAQHCNLNCKCCTAFSPIAEKSFLNIESYNNDMAKLAKLTGNRLSSFGVTGGEPLLHPQITEIFTIARNYFPETDIFFMTNGLLLLGMPETFWENIKQNNIAINLSRYPIQINVDKIIEKAKSYNVKFDYVGGGDVPVKLMWKYPLDVDGKQPLKRSYNICTQINRCVTMKDGIIYPCNTIAGIEHFNKYFNKNLKVTAEDVLELHNVKDINEVYEFLYTPKPFCKYCNRRGVEFGIKYGNSKKDITEWT